MEYKELAKYLKKEDLTGDIAEIAGACGFEVAVALLCEFAGMKIWIPKTPFSSAIERYIRKNRNKMKTRDMARELGLSERVVQNFLSEIKMDHPNQLYLFEEENG